MAGRSYRQESLRDVAHAIAYKQVAKRRLLAGVLDEPPPPDDAALSVIEAEQFEDWREWINETVPLYLWPPFADYHEVFWNWVWSIRLGRAARPFVAVWSRGFAKSTSVEVATAMLAARNQRKYGFYVCATQDQADTHVQNVAGILESDSFSRRFAVASRRSVGKYNLSKGWRRNRLRTANGFTLDAIGLDTAARGAKVDEVRPDLIILDDIDELLDSPQMIAKKEQLITKSIIPAGVAGATVVLVAQNLIHDDGIVARLCNGKARYLANRIVSGPYPAIEGLVTEEVNGRTVITDGVSTWLAKSIADLQNEIDTSGISAFLAEFQHDVTILEGGMFGAITFKHIEVIDQPDYEDIQVWVDPAVTDTDQSDANGICAAGRGGDGNLYVLFSWEERSSPEQTLRKAILKARELGASCVGIETDQGGDTWRPAYGSVWDALVSDGTIPAHERMIAFRQDKAGAGHGSKAHRTSLMLQDYELGNVIHVKTGTYLTLERALRRYLLKKPYDLVDAEYYCWHHLIRRTRPSKTAPRGIRQTSSWVRQEVRR